MRRRRAEINVELRKQKKTEGIFKRRNIDTISPENYQTVKILSFPEIVQGLQSVDVHIKYAAAQSARRILSQEKCPPIDNLIEAGVVPNLVACLTCHDNASLQLEASSVLAIITSGTSAQTEAVVLANAVPVLINLLLSKDLNIAFQAVTALGNVAGDSAHLRNIVIENGVITPLISLLSTNISPILCQAITCALSSVCKHKNPDPPFKAVKECLPAFSKLICHSDMQTVTYACWGLYYLSDGPNEKIQQVIDAGVVPRLVSLLQLEGTFIMPALKTIGNIISGGDTQTQAVIDQDGLVPLKKLINHHDKNIISECCWILSNVTAGNTDQIQSVIESNIMKAVINVLVMGDFQSKKEASWAVANLSFHGNLKQVCYLVTVGAISPLCNLLEINDVQLVTILLEALKNILSADCKLDKGQKASHLIQECGGLDKIENLQKHVNVHVRNAAFDILDTFFQLDDVFDDCDS